MSYDPHDPFGRVKEPSDPPPRTRKAPPPKRGKAAAFAKLKVLETLMGRLVERPDTTDEDTVNAVRNVERAMTLSAQLVDMPVESARRGVTILRDSIATALAKDRPDDVSPEDWRLFQQFGDSMRADIKLVLVLADAVEEIQSLLGKKRAQYPELAATFADLAGDLPEGATMKSFVVSPVSAARPTPPPPDPGIDITIDDECPCPECRAEREKNQGGHDDDPPIIRG